MFKAATRQPVGLLFHLTAFAALIEPFQFSPDVRQLWVCRSFKAQVRKVFAKNKVQAAPIDTRKCECLQNYIREKQGSVSWSDHGHETSAIVQMVSFHCCVLGKGKFSSF